SNKSVKSSNKESKHWTSKNVKLVACAKNHEVFGNCFFLQHLTTEQIVVGKEVSKVKGLMRSREALREKKFWSKVSKYSKFYPLYGIVDVANRQCFVTENIPSISLKALISGRPLQETDVAPICAQIILAVSYLHENNIVHRALRPEIISIDWRGVVRVADLTTCEVFERSERVMTEFSSDWWNVGVIFYELLTGKVLFADKHTEIVCKNMSKESLKEALKDVIKMAVSFPDQISQNARSLLTGLLEKNLSTAIGDIHMDLSTSAWRTDYINVCQMLGDDYGSTFGKCYAISHTKTGDEAMLKIIWKSRMRQTSNGWRIVMNERLSWQKVTKHKYILPLQAFFETEACYCFISNYVDACSLSVVIKSAPLQEEVVKVLSGQLAIALEYCHQKGIIIRNLNPDGILVEKSGRIRLADFEFAKEAEYCRSRVAQYDYMSPEMIMRQEYGKEADWYAFGVILFELCIGFTPFDIYCRKKGLNPNNVGTDVLLRGLL
ncbi:putative AGC/PKA protein kinase-like protein, partial [Dinothrombium tinctorium]